MDEGLAGEGELLFGGRCWWERAHIVVLGPCKSSAPILWEEAIWSASGGRLVVYADGSRDIEGRVSGGWFADGNGAGSVAVGNVATIRDGEVAGIHPALQVALDVDILVLTDSRASLLAIRRSACSGKGRASDLVEVVNEVCRHSQVGLSTQFGWVKAHVGIEGSKHTDRIAKAGCKESLLPKVT